MKRIKLYLLIAVFVLSIVFLSSCAVIDIALDIFGVEPQDAIQLYERINRKTADCDSYTVSGRTSIILYTDGYKVSGHSDIRQLFVRLSGGEFYYLSENEMTLSSSSSLVATGTSVIRSGYYDGHAYMYNEGIIGRWKENGVYSKISAKEYSDYLNDGADMSLGSRWVYQCESQSFEHNEDGSWSLVFTDYDEDVIAEVVKSAGLDSDVYDYKVKDIEVKMTADEDFICQSMSISLIIDSDITGDFAPRYIVNANFSEFGNTKIDKSVFNKDEYNEVLDIRLFEQFENAMEDIEDSERNTFEYDVSTKLSVLGTEDTYSEKELVTYGTEDGKYFFNIKSIVDGNSSTAVYSDGSMTVSSGGEEPDVEDMKEYVAKALVRNYLFCGYNKYYVTGIKKSGHNTYEVIMNGSPSDIGGFGQIQGVSVKDKSITMTLTFAGDKLTSIDAVYNAKCNITVGNSTYSGTLTSDISIKYGIDEHIWDDLLPNDNFNEL